MAYQCGRRQLFSELALMRHNRELGVGPTLSSYSCRTAGGSSTEEVIHQSRSFAVDLMRRCHVTGGSLAFTRRGQQTRLVILEK